MTLNSLPQSVAPQPDVLADSSISAVAASEDKDASESAQRAKDEEMLTLMTGLPGGTKPSWSDVVNFVRDLKREKKKPYLIAVLLKRLTEIYDRLYPGPPLWNPFFLADFSLFFARELQLPRAKRPRSSPSCQHSSRRGGLPIRPSKV